VRTVPPANAVITSSAESSGKPIEIVSIAGSTKPASWSKARNAASSANWQNSRELASRSLRLAHVLDDEVPDSGIHSAASPAGAARSSLDRADGCAPSARCRSGPRQPGCLAR
jgi:hypothetical protein